MDGLRLAERLPIPNNSVYSRISEVSYIEISCQYSPREILGFRIGRSLPTAAHRRLVNFNGCCETNLTLAPRANNVQRQALAYRRRMRFLSRDRHGDLYLQKIRNGSSACNPKAFSLHSSSRLSCKVGQL